MRNFDIDNALLIVADSWPLLRPCDLGRLFDTYFDHRAEIMARLLEERPDLRRRAEGELAIAEDAEAAFALANDPPPHVPQRFHPQSNTLQKVCVEGMGCLPGQQDLF